MDRANCQDQHVIVTNNTTLPPTDVTTAKMVNFQVTESELEVDKISHAKCTTNNVTSMANLCSHNNNAIDANHAHKDKTSLETHAKFQDHNVIATNNTTLPPTNVTDAQLVSYLIMEVPFKIDNAQDTQHNAVPTINSNNHKNNAMLVPHVPD
jgi:hypothetical protein